MTIIYQSVSHRWDGSSLPADKQVFFTISVLADSLVVSVDAPYYNNPPPAAPPGNCEGLWEHEVVELFIKGKLDKYLELELGPRGHFLVLLCDGYRQCFVRKLVPINYEAKINGDRWTARLEISLDLLPPCADIFGAPFTFNAFAMHNDPQREYCIAFPPADAKVYPVPDFHKLELFRPLDISVGDTSKSSESVWLDRTTFLRE